MKNPFSLENKTVLVTGASSGLGRACAVSASRMGADLILVARNGDELDTTFQMLEKGKHTIVCQDITEYETLPDAVEKGVSGSGKISGFIHSAGIEITMPLKMLKPSHYEKLFSVNVIAGFEIAKIISKKKYLNENGGSFVFISSTMGAVGQQGLIGYCLSKSALISGVKAMALEMVSNHIRANCVLPGHVEGTKMADKLFKTLSEDAKNAIRNAHPLGLGNPEDVANACIYLLSDASRWVTGTCLNVDGGYLAR